MVALPERECTIQRRNQKVIEESPSTFLDDKTRHAMQDQAASLARSVGYNSAGTVEFLVDKHRNFFFLEMNTRLQVEHPVSEEISGVDLVELMIRSAAGERLPAHLTSGRVPILGHSFEARVYAEDPFRGFLPSTGRLSGYIEPQTFGAEGRDPYLDPATIEPVARPDGSVYETKSIRADAGVALGSEISMFYDPMICKMVTHGATRDSALDRMRACLDAYVLRGVGHNISFLRDLCEHPRFISGAIDTRFIQDEYPQGFQGVQLAPQQRLQMVAVAAIMNDVRTAAAGEVSGRSEFASLPETREVVVTVGRKTVLGEGKEAQVTHPECWLVRMTHGNPADVYGDADGGAASPAADAFESVPLGDGGVYEMEVTPLDATKPGVHPAGPAQTVRLGNVDWSVDSPLFLAGNLDVKAGEPESHNTLRVQHVSSRAGGGLAVLLHSHAVLAPWRWSINPSVGARSLTACRSPHPRPPRLPFPHALPRRWRATRTASRSPPTAAPTTCSCAPPRRTPCTRTCCRARCATSAACWSAPCPAPSSPSRWPWATRWRRARRWRSWRR